MTPLHWKIFAEFLREDYKEKSDFYRNMAEYTMSFHNYQAVKSVQDSREEEKYRLEDDDGENEEDIFFKQLQAMGIDLNKQKLDEARYQAEQQEQQETSRHRSVREQVQEQDIVRLIQKDD